MSLHTYAGFIAEKRLNEKSCGDIAPAPCTRNKVHLRIKRKSCAEEQHFYFESPSHLPHYLVCTAAHGFTFTPLPTGLCKIGRSSDSVAKLATLQIGKGKMRISDEVQLKLSRGDPPD